MPVQHAKNEQTSREAILPRKMVAAVRYRLEAPVQGKNCQKRRNMTDPKRGSHATSKFLRSKRLVIKGENDICLARMMRWNVRGGQVGDRQALERLRLEIIIWSITRGQKV